MFNGSAYVLEIDLANTCRQVTNLPVEASRVLRLFDGRRGLSEVLDDSQLEVPKTLRVVQRLAAQGFVRLTQRAGTTRTESARGPRRGLDAEVKRWLGLPDALPAELDAFDDGGLEAALDAALGGPDHGPEDNESRCVPLEAIPDAMEESLMNTVDQCSALEDLLESTLEEILDDDGDLEELLLPASDPNADVSGFTPLEEEFFESYIPEEMDGDLEEILEEVRAESLLPACTK